jgi:Ca2+-binding EF-hand superfamily protein
MLFAGSAHAQPGGGFGPPPDRAGPGARGGGPAVVQVGREVLRAADTDADRKVTLEDLRAVVPGFDAEVFAGLDHDGDGVLAADDRPQRPAYGRLDGERPGRQGVRGPRGDGLREKFAEADTDGDREVTFEELQAVMPRLEAEHFERMDRNGDGVLSSDDRPEGARGAGRPGGGGPGAGLREADANKDRALSLDEIQAVRPGFTQERFEQMDVNGDGLLTREDREARGNRGGAPRSQRGGLGQGPGRGQNRGQGAGGW